MKNNFKEEIMMAANITPSSALNIPRGGRSEKAFYKYKKIQGNLFRRSIPKMPKQKDLGKKFKDLLEQ